MTYERESKMASSDDQAQDQFDRMKAEVDAEAAQGFAADDADDDHDDGSFLWAIVQYEEGTSGPLKEAAGILVDDEVGVTILDPETGFATSFGDRFVVRVDVQAVNAGEAEDDEETKDQVDTSADRFRA